MGVQSREAHLAARPLHCPEGAILEATRRCRGRTGGDSKWPSLVGRCLRSAKRRDEVADDTAFERLVLDRAMPLLPASEARSVIDLRGPGVSVAVTPMPARAYVGGAPGTVGVAELRPLIFGAAWESAVAQLVVGVGDREAGHDRGGERERPPPTLSLPWRLDRRPRPVDADHASVRLNQDAAAFPGASPAQSGRCHWAHGRHARPEEPVPRSITAAEQSAFCRAAQGTVGAVIAGVLPRRRPEISSTWVSISWWPTKLDDRRSVGRLCMGLSQSYLLTPSHCRRTRLRLIRCKSWVVRSRRRRTRRTSISGFFYPTAGSWRATWTTHPLTASPSASTTLPTGLRW